MSIYESTWFFTYGTICRIFTFGYQQQKNPALKNFHCLQFSNFVNLRIYAVFHLSYNIQDLYIWKSTNQQQKNQALKIFQCLQFSNFINLWIYSVFHLYMQDLYIWRSTNQQQKNPALNIFQCVQFLQFCQSTNLRGFSPMVQYSGYVHLKINSKKIQL